MNEVFYVITAELKKGAESKLLSILEDGNLNPNLKSLLEYAKIINEFGKKLLYFSYNPLKILPLGEVGNDLIKHYGTNEFFDIRRIEPTEGYFYKKGETLEDYLKKLQSQTGD